MQKLVAGVRRFEKEIFPADKQFFTALAEGQNPQALLITCSDSRIVPVMMTQSRPGDLFLIRNAGNMVPPYGNMVGGVSATIEYAVMALGIENIIVCGHSKCGAMKGALHPESLTEMPAVSQWLGLAESARRVVVDNCKDLPMEEMLDELTKQNVLAQIDHLKTHPSVASKFAAGKMNLFGWMHYIESGKTVAYDPEVAAFVEFDENRIPVAVAPRKTRAMNLNQPVNVGS